MNKSLITVVLISLAATFFTTGCRKKGSVWDDNHTLGYYRTDRSLWDSEEAQNEDLVGPDEDAFIALNDEDLKAQFSDGAIPQPKHIPGEAGSGVPSLASFHAPKAEELAVFANVYFNTDDHILRGKDALASLDKIAAYLKSHPKTYISVEGHADERAPEAYNLALGSRRANYVRSKLVEKGVSPERVHTISYGKERPVRLEHTPEAWSKNRRVEFKIYHKS